MSELLASLKSRTADCHDRLERQLGLGEIDFDRSTYTRIVCAFLGFIAPWEARVVAALPHSFANEFAARRKTPWLEHDVAALGATPELVARCASLGVAATVPGLFGAWYVIEGSTLGGRFIAPAAAGRFGLSDGDGNRYFEGYGANTGSQWKAFRLLTERAVGETGVAIDACVDGARATFAAMAAWFGAAGIGTERGAEVLR